MTTRAINGYIIEGVSGVGKSWLLGALQAELVRRWPGCTKLELSEHYTDRVFEDARALGEADFDNGLPPRREATGHRRPPPTRPSREASVSQFFQKTI